MVNELMEEMWEAASAGVLRAGEEILRVARNGGRGRERMKRDGSPVTEADEAAEEVLLEVLGEWGDYAATVSEEAVERGEEVEVGERCFLVDPLDGTRGFADGGDEYTVNVGLVEGGRVTGGVVYAPGLGRGFRAYGGKVEEWRGGGWRGMEFGELKEEGERRILVSRALGARTREGIRVFYGGREVLGVSSSWKFCLLASGGGDVYPRDGTTSAWDTAAGQAILEASGGRVLSKTGGGVLRYDGLREGRYGNPGFVAWAPSGGEGERGD